MKKILLFILVQLFYVTLNGQIISSAELPEPGKISLAYLNSLNNKNILYGATPTNYNGKVLVFNHGLAGSTEYLLIGNGLYSEAYNSGYRTAFVSTTRLQGDWVNGEILSRALSQITRQYEIETVDLIVHSNGGKASEVALFHYDKKDLVDKVISLGTPYKGTVIADISQRKGLKWLIDLIGLSPGAQLSTTYYCESYFRPFFDNHPLNQPHKYYSFGAWGHRSFNGILSPVLRTTGSIMMLFGSGPNDGITPFYSSTRPGSHQIAALNDQRGYLNHMDIAYSRYVWYAVLFPILNGDASTDRGQQFNDTTSQTPFRAESNYQILSSDRPHEHAILGKTKNTVSFEIIHKEVKSQLNVVDLAKNRVVKKIKTNATLNRSTSDSLAQHLTSFTFDNPDFHTIKIQGDTDYLAYITDGVESPMIYTIHKENDRMFAMLSFPNLKPSEINRLEIKAKAEKTANLLEIEELSLNDVDLIFKWNGDHFMAELNNLPIGVYSLSIDAEIPHEYRRNIISGFVVDKALKTLGETAQTTASEKLFQLSSIPSNASTFLISTKYFNKPVHFSIYGINGSQVSTFKTPKMERTFPIGTYFSSLTPGTYILQIDSEEHKQTIKFMIQ